MSTAQPLDSASVDRFKLLASVLLPQWGPLPAAGELDGFDQLLSTALDCRPDLGPALRDALQTTIGLSAEEAVRSLLSGGGPPAEALTTLAAGTYLMHPEVRRVIGYPGQVPQQVRDDIDSYAELLEAVVERDYLVFDDPPPSSDSSAAN